ncbi:DUF192 domain-containing protein [Candidatus Micrarchaeota archaeon]|nr:DUF192 domain-containing protein [Candidatus Micrarchaeota archaeon]
MALFVVEKGKKKLLKLLFRSFHKTGFFTRFVGLMFKNSFSIPLLFVGNGRIAIHSFFCPEFEAVFLDNRRRVASIVFVKPSQLVKRRAFYLFEFPQGTVSQHRIKKGDEITWSNK